MEEVVALWNEDHPDVRVTVSDQGAGEDAVAKFLTASRAGAPPDLVQAEYQALTTLAARDAVADLTEFTGEAERAFTPAVWEQVTIGTDAVYAIPQDSGPMMLYYRSDLFEEYGLDVPTTWEEFAEVGRQVRDEHPEHRLTSFSATDPGWFAGLSQQAGATWWDTSTDTWSVAIDDEPTLRVAQYWQDLLDEDVITGQPMYTPAWNSALNDGSLLAWPSAVWAPGVLSGNAASTAGDWSMAPLPQWEEGESVTGSWGGSATGVARGSAHTEAAAEFAIWLNTSPEAVEAMVEHGGIYPAATEAREGPAFEEPPEFFAHQENFYPLAAEIAEGAAPVVWGPNVNVAYETYKDAFAAAISGGTSFTEAVDRMQETTLTDMRGRGFSVDP
jgi:multiple sugar transport system substrate-binding protein